MYRSVAPRTIVHGLLQMALTVAIVSVTSAVLAQRGAFQPASDSQPQSADGSPLRWKKSSRGDVQPAGSFERVARSQPTNGSNNKTSPAKPQVEGDPDYFGEEVPAPTADAHVGGQHYPHGGFHEHGDCCHDDCDSPCDSCCDDCQDGCDCRCDCKCQWRPEDYLSLFAGVHAFKGPSDYPPPGIFTNGGNFGVHQGFNAGIPLDDESGFGAQVGGQLYHSNLSGSGIVGFDINNPIEPVFIDDERHQVFLTGGVFRRTHCGLQGGVVYDYLHDDYYTSNDFHQIRGELSRVCPNGREVGVMAMNGFDSEKAVTVNGLTTLWEPTDQYLLFYRMTHKGGGNFRIAGGLTDRGDGIAGADFQIPINCNLVLTGSATYLLPEQGERRSAEAIVRGDAGYQQEAWSIGINLVWYPNGFRKGCCSCGDRFMPLMNVADNGSFVIDRHPLDVALVP